MSVPEALLGEIEAQGGVVRKLKEDKSPEDEVKAAVDKLLKLKLDYKTLTGQDPPSGGGGRRPKKEKAAIAKENKQQQQQQQNGGDGKKQTRLGMEASKEGNFAEWYSQVITKSEMIEYYDVSGCYILRPWSYSVWEEIQVGSFLVMII